MKRSVRDCQGGYFEFPPNLISALPSDLLRGGQIRIPYVDLEVRRCQDDARMNRQVKENAGNGTLRCRFVTLAGSTDGRNRVRDNDADAWDRRLFVLPCGAFRVLLRNVRVQSREGGPINVGNFLCRACLLTTRINRTGVCSLVRGVA